MQVKLRNNTARLWTIAGKSIKPNESETFEENDLKPYLGNPAFVHSLKVGDLQDFPINELPPPEKPEVLTQLPKPDAQIGEKTSVKVENSEEVAKLLQSGAPTGVAVKSAPEALPDLAALANNTPAQ